MRRRCLRGRGAVVSVVSCTDQGSWNGPEHLSSGALIIRSWPALGSASRSASMTTAANDRQTCRGDAVNGRKRRRLLVLMAAGGLMWAPWGRLAGDEVSDPPAHPPPPPPPPAPPPPPPPPTPPPPAAS